MGIRVIVTLAAESSLAKVPYHTIRRSRLGTVSRPAINLRMFSRGSPVSYSGGPSQAAAWVFRGSAPTFLTLMDQLKDSYAPQLSQGDLARVDPDAKDGGGYKGSSSGNFRWTTGGFLAATAVAILAAWERWFKDKSRRRYKAGSDDTLHNRRQGEGFMPHLNPPYFSSGLFRQSALTLQPASTVMGRMTTMEACSVADVAAEAAITTSVGTADNAQAGQGPADGRVSVTESPEGLGKAHSHGQGAGGVQDLYRIGGIVDRQRHNLEHAMGTAVTSADSKVRLITGEKTPVASVANAYLFDSSEHPVGRGQNSTVFGCTDRFTGQAVAVKKISREHSSRREVMEEVRMLKIAGKHPNVVTLRAFFEDEDAYYIVTELCEGGELYRRLADRGRYSEGQAARIMAEIAAAVGFLHNHGIVHFDLKPENILLTVGEDSVPEVRLTDFGSAFRQYSVVPQAKAFTLWYGAPEVLAQEPVDEKVDMWAVGVIMWVLLTGQHPFDANSDLSEEEVACRIMHEEPDFKCRGIRHVSPEGKDLLRRLLSKDPESRPSAREMLSHPWFRAVMSRPKISGRHQALAPDLESPGVAASVMPIVSSRSRHRSYYRKKGERSSSPAQHSSAPGSEGELTS